MTLRTLSFALLPLLTLTTLRANAAETPDTPSTTDSELQWSGQLGAVGGEGYGGALIGTTLLARSGVFAFGGTMEASGAFASRFGLSGLAGIAGRTEGGTGGELLGTLGMHHYNGVGRGILSDDPGASATLPFAGVRVRASQRLGRRFLLGLAATLEQDLYRERRVYSYTSTPWLDFGNSGPTTETKTRMLGFTTVGVMFDVGATF